MQYGVGVDPIVIIGAIIYFVLIILVGVYSKKRTVSDTDYYVAGRSVGAFTNGAALTSTYLSPASFLGMPCFIFLLGYPFWWAMVAIIGGMPLAALMTAGPLRKYAPVSFTDYYCDRYDMPIAGRFVAGIPTLIAGILYVILSLVGTAIFMVALLHMPYKLSVLIAAIIVLLYTVLGGMYATTWNAAFQCILMTLAGVVLAIAMVAKLGGWSSYWHSILATSPKMFNVPSDPAGVQHPFMAMWLGVIGFYFTWHYGFAAMPYTVVRFFTTMDVKTARKSILWTTVLGGILYASLCIIGSGARVIMESFHPLAAKAAPIAAAKGKPLAIIILVLIKKTFGIGKVTDYAIIAAAESVGSSVLMAIIVAGGLSIAMSTVAGWIMVLNSLISRDWFGKVFGSKFAEEKPVLSARIWTIIILVVCGLIALSPPALVLDLSGWAFVVILASIGPSMVLGIWWKRATKAAAIWTALLMTPASFLTWLYAKVHFGKPHFFFLNKKIITPHQFYWIFVGFILFIIISLMTKPPAEETVQKYCVELHEPE
jgi:Na+(H+)/acetate symporter ActP